jgi:hypothetical protein
MAWNNGLGATQTVGGSELQHYPRHRLNRSPASEKEAAMCYLGKRQLKFDASSMLPVPS